MAVRCALSNHGGGDPPSASGSAGVRWTGAGVGAGRVGTATGLHGAQGVSPGACFPKKTGEHGAQPKPGRVGLRCRLFRRRLLCTRRLGRLQTLQHSLGCSSPGPARAHQQQTTREGALEGQPELPRPLTERTTRCRAWATARRAASCLPCSLETHLQCLGGGRRFLSIPSTDISTPVLPALPECTHPQNDVQPSWRPGWRSQGSPGPPKTRRARLGTCPAH